jgi:hypothetical protein
MHIAYVHRRHPYLVDEIPVHGYMQIHTRLIRTSSQYVTQQSDLWLSQSAPACHAVMKLGDSQTTSKRFSKYCHTYDNLLLVDPQDPHE